MNLLKYFLKICLGAVLLLLISLTSTNHSFAAAITDVIPTGKHGLAKGDKVCVGIQKLTNPTFGEGKITELSKYSAFVKGNYNLSSIPIVDVSGKGEWEFSLNSKDRGNTYDGGLKISGKINKDKINEDIHISGPDFEKGSPKKCDATISYTDANDKSLILNQSCQNDGPFQKAKLYVQASNLKVQGLGNPQLYIRNRNYGSCY